MTTGSSGFNSRARRDSRSSPEPPSTTLLALPRTSASMLISTGSSREVDGTSGIPGTARGRRSRRRTSRDPCYLRAQLGNPEFTAFSFEDGLGRPVSLATCARIARRRNLLLSGHAGIGKSWFGEAFAERASTLIISQAPVRGAILPLRGAGDTPPPCVLKSSAGRAPGDHYLDAPILLPAGLGPF
jgi:hypothetical protein